MYRLSRLSLGPLDRAATAVLVAGTALYVVVAALLAFTAANTEAKDVRGGAVDEATAQLVGLSALGPRLTGDPQQRLTPSDVAPLDTALARLAREGGTRIIRLWRTDGTLLYRPPGDYGTAMPPSIERARRGEAWTVVGTAGSHGNLTTYVPVMTGGRADGIIEGTQPLDPILADEAEERRGVFVFVGIAGGAAWLGMLPLTLRGARLAGTLWNPRRRHMLRDVERGMAAGELEVHYQPKVDLVSGRLSGVEALVRWRRDGTLVPPGAFLPVVEDSVLMRPLTLFVLETALRQARAWDDDGRPSAVAVNLAPANLDDPRLVDDVRAALRRHGVPAAQLTLELTETAVIQDEDAAGKVLRRLADLGICLSVDDFGTGHSSLSRLTRHPFTELKIDQSFVRELIAERRPVVASLIQLAKSLHLKVVAEGVEDEATLNALRALGCDVVQGFLLARPVPADEIRHIAERLEGLSRTASEVRTLLDHVRESLSLDAAFVAEFAGDDEVFRLTSGDAESFGAVEGGTEPLENTYCGRVVSGVLPNLIPDAQHDERTRDLPGTASGIGAYIGVPIYRDDGTVYGTLCGLGKTARADLTSEQVTTLNDFGARISSLLDSANLAVSARDRRGADGAPLDAVPGVDAEPQAA